MIGDRSLLENAFERLVAAARGNARALLVLAENACRSGDVVRCLNLVKDAQATDPDDPEIASTARTILARNVPGWHFPMMQDADRNQAFLQAIERAVKPGMKVLDIGSGSGLLAMMAARAGAAEVHSCEVNPVIADVAREIVGNNGFADQITLHTCNSKRLDPEADLGGRVDLIVSEIIGKDLVCEEVLPTMRDAVRRLAKPGAQFIPQAGEIRIALGYFEDLERYRAADSCGFDLSPFNRLLSSRLKARADDPGLALRGEPLSLFSFDFTSSDHQRERVQAELVASGGTVNGMVQWFRLQMDADGSFENAPGPGSSPAWKLGFVPFDASRELDAGDRVAIAASVGGNRLHIWET
jgi:protein arginine N-methyltransferase 7